MSSSAAARAAFSLKILGRARVVEAADDPALIAALMPEGGRGRPERAILIDVAGFDWNCPAHIPQRFTTEEIGARFAALEQENAALRAALDAASAPGPAPAGRGS
jgi:predicted pyridoxine 5'-phosphate oxidase superfamily flavin-nucleotide-binding protein